MLGAILLIYICMHFELPIIWQVLAWSNLIWTICKGYLFFFQSVYDEDIYEERN